MLLQEFKPGDTVTIVRIAGEERHVRRLYDMGMRQGVVVRIVRRALFNGPFELEVDGIHIGIRITDDIMIEVQRAGAM